MKKTVIFKMACLGACMAIGVTKLCLELTPKDNFVNLMISNVEALATGGETTLAKECYDRYDSYGRKSTRVRICETCDYATVFNPKKNTICPK